MEARVGIERMRVNVVSLCNHLSYFKVYVHRARSAAQCLDCHNSMVVSGNAS
jgi:hypothetical protein